MKNEWTITGLKQAMLADLAACHSDFERSMVKAIGGREIREKAADLAAVRKLTPAETAIAAEFGYRGQA
jgi:hypothetical protein